MDLIVPPPEGIGLLGTPGRHARTSWLAPVTTRIPDGDDNSDPPINLSAANLANEAARPGPAFPMWFEAAVRLGTGFLRIAAASTPPATTLYLPKCSRLTPQYCCKVCGKSHAALIDEYYCWIEASECFDPVTQVAEWGSVPDSPLNSFIGNPEADWYRPGGLPALLAWSPHRIVHLHWCRVHNGEFQTPRRSAGGVKITNGLDPLLEFSGRSGDSLAFTVVNAVRPPNTPPPGFRYDIAPDDAITLPELVPTPPPAAVGGLPAFPYFAWACPGAPILPRELVAPALSVAMHLATDCRYEDALKWLELSYRPLESDNTWSVCKDGDGGDGDDGNDGDNEQQRR
jgi:hypothetical protein